MPRLTIAALTLAMLPVAAVGQSATLADAIGIRADDRQRLDGLDSATGAAFRQVLAMGSEGDVAIAFDTMRGAALPLERVDTQGLAGDWSCQMTKMGGNLPLVSYPEFKCRISVEGDQLQFEKLTGSQKTKGAFYRDGERMVYLGSTFVTGETPMAYADFPAEVNSDSTDTLPDVGVLEVLSPNRARLILPMPYKESYLNVLKLTR